MPRCISTNNIPVRLPSLFIKKHVFGACASKNNVASRFLLASAKQESNALEILLVDGIHSKNNACLYYYFRATMKLTCTCTHCGQTKEASRKDQKGAPDCRLTRALASPDRPLLRIVPSPIHRRCVCLCCRYISLDREACPSTESHLLRSTSR